MAWVFFPSQRISWGPSIVLSANVATTRPWMSKTLSWTRSGS